MANKNYGKDSGEPEPIPAEVGVQPVTVDLLAQVLQNLPKGLDAEALAQILANQQQQTQAAIEKTRIVRHSNADHEHISAFSYPRGDLAQPKPRHVTRDGQPREVYFNGAREYEEQLTPEEIDAYNAITEARTSRDGQWTVRFKQDGKILLLEVPSYTPDDRAAVPPLVLVLREMALGTKAADPVTMAARLAALEKAVADKGLVVPG
jgi:hypothetical protein